MKKFLLVLFVLFLTGCTGENDVEVDVVEGIAPTLSVVESVEFKLKAPRPDWLSEEFVLEATDDTVDPTLKVVEDNVDFEEVGKYEVVIAAVDEDGLETTKTILVSIIDGVAPFIKERTSFPEKVGVGNKIPDWNLYISVIDAYEGSIEITEEMISVELDTSVVGESELTISAFDSSGNVATKTFTVNIVNPYTITLDDIEYLKTDEGYTITSYTNAKKFNIEIPATFNGEPVIGIFGGAFTSEGIRTLILNEGIKEIGNEAFKGNFISSLIIPDSVEYIGNEAFSKNNLYSLSMNSTTELGESVFNNNYIELFNNEVSNGLIFGSGEVFDETTVVSYGGASEIVDFIPSTVKTIEAFSFLRNNLVEVVIPNTVEYIDEMAFAINNISRLTLPNTVSLGEGVFARNELEFMNGLSSDGFVYEQSNGTVDETNINSYAGINKDVVIPNGVVEIGPSAFYLAGLNSLVIPKTVMEIGANAFKGNKSLTALEIQGEHPERLGTGLVGYGFDELLNFDISLIESDGKSLIVFVSFDNYRDYELGVPFDTFHDFYKGDISLEGYLEDISYGQYKLDVEFLSDDFTFYYDEQPMEYYMRKSDTNPIGYETEAEESTRFDQLFVGMINWIDSEGFIEDGRLLDSDNDNMIDNIMIFHLGRGGWSDLLWPKQGRYSGPRLTIADKIVNEFITLSLGNPEEASLPSSLSTYAHEYLHLLGAADYYQYGGVYANSIKPWEIMASGGELKHPLQFLKQQYLGIEVDMEETTTGGTFTINNTMNSESNFLRIDIGDYYESIYIEYRAGDSIYDRDVPDSGLLVYRVNNRYIGNTKGVYNSLNQNMEEIHIFKPAQYDPVLAAEGTYIIQPIAGYENSGYAYNTANAAMNMNSYQEMGMGTDVKMYFADGSEMPIRITLDAMDSETATITVEFIE